MLDALRDIKDLLFTQINYSLNEKLKLTALCKIAQDKFKHGYHESVFKQLGIEEPIPDQAIKSEELKLKEFQQNGSHLFNAEVKKIAKSLEAYINAPDKAYTSYRVNKIIFILLHRLTVNQLFVERYGCPLEIEKRVKEVQNIQDWIGGIIESQNPKFIDDGDLLKGLELANEAFDIIVEILEEEKTKLERQDILNGFEGEIHLKNVINNIAEYISSLPGNSKGFSALELFQGANIRNSNIQKFLIGTNIGRSTLTIFLSSENTQKLFLASPDIREIHCFIEEIDPTLEINKDLWATQATQNLIIDSLLLLGQLAGSAEISKEVKAIFSGITGNVGLLTSATKGKVMHVFSMTSDGLLKLQDSIKAINEEALKLTSLSAIKRTELRRLQRSCKNLISEAIKNYEKVRESIARASTPENLFFQFKASLDNLEAGIASFQATMFPLLPLERQATYAITNYYNPNNYNNKILEVRGAAADNTASMARTSIRNNSSLLALTVEVSPSSLHLEHDERRAQIEEIEASLEEPWERSYQEESSGVQPIMSSAYTPPQKRREVENYGLDHMTQIARTYIEVNHRKLVANGNFIETHKAKIITAFQKQKNDNIVAISDNTNQVLKKYVDNKNTIRNLKAIGAIGSAIMVPAVTGIGVGVALHYTTWVALSGVAAVAPFGAITAAAIGGATLIIAGGIAAYRVYHMSPEERCGRSTFSLWISEMGNCFTFNNEHMRNQNIYRRLSNWSGCLYGCVKELIYITGEENIDFALKTLKAVLYYLPSQDKALLEEYHPEGSKRQNILKQAIKLRYAFLKLIQENQACFIEEVTVEASTTHVEEEIPANYSFKLDEKDTKTIEAAKTAFICLIYGTIEHLQMKKEEALKRAAPNTSFAGSTTEEVINNNKCIGRN